MLHWDYIRTQNIEMSRKKFIYDKNNFVIIPRSYELKGK
jgi:hypothetical protein